jgi:DNA-binding transcriptional regulator YhcF (GntR family)
VARYREIADDLRAKIQAGIYPVGTKLPSISDLQEQYDVPALNTIRGAQQVLVDEGMLETRQGVGAFVIAADSLGEFDVTATLAQARDSLTTVLAALEAKASQQVVIESVAALQTTMRFAERRLGAAKWEPASGSEAASELSNTETRHGGGPWGEDAPRTAYAAANLMMTGVVDNLGSLHQLLDDRMPVIGPTVVARSAIEIGAGAWWLMEPGIGVRRRVCRELALSLASARRAKQVAEEFQAKGFQVGPAITEALQQEARVLQRITDLGIATPTSGYYPVIENEQAMKATVATAAMLKAILPANVPAQSIYHTYSAVTHGQIYGLLNFMAPGVTSDGSSLLHWHLPPDVLDSTIQMAIAAFREAYRRINKVMGWGKLEGDLWEIKLGKIYNS